MAQSAVASLPTVVASSAGGVGPMRAVVRQRASWFDLHITWQVRAVHKRLAARGPMVGKRQPRPLTPSAVLQPLEQPRWGSLLLPIGCVATLHCVRRPSCSLFDRGLLVLFGSHHRPLEYACLSFVFCAAQPSVSHSTAQLILLNSTREYCSRLDVQSAAHGA